MKRKKKETAVSYVSEANEYKECSLGPVEDIDETSEKVIHREIAHLSPNKENVRWILENLHNENVKHVQNLNLGILPVVYTNDFYRKHLLFAKSGQPMSVFTQVARHPNKKVIVGSICCELRQEKHEPLELCVMTLAVNLRYRRLGVGSILMEKILDEARKYEDKNPISLKPQRISRIILHVQTNNTDAIAFYKRHGFLVRERIENFYRRLTSSDCFVMTRGIKRL